LSVTVKICGITNTEDALVAVDAGADALGFIFYEKSPRFVTTEAVAAIIQQLTRPVARVGVFVNATVETVLEAMSRCHLSLLQFHGDESPEFCLQFGLMNMKAFRVRDDSVFQEMQRYPTDAWLLDAFSPAGLGGTGETFNWDLAIRANQLGRPIFLAGGLTPDNVAEAVARVRPFGVDVSSGVEATPGRKDHAKVRAFIQAARNAAAGPSL
jgi:phosphoribosylanthranilate isomerase